jgi:hypothetical protein
MDQFGDYVLNSFYQDTPVVVKKFESQFRQVAPQFVALFTGQLGLYIHHAEFD